MRKGSCTTIRGPQAFPYFLLESDFGNHPSYIEVIHAPTGCLVAQVTGMSPSFSLSKLTPWLSALPLTSVWGLWGGGCRLCNGKHAGKVFCSCTCQALGLLVNAPKSQGEYTAVKYSSVSGLSSDLPLGFGH